MSNVSVGIPVISPVLGSNTKLSGRLGDISYVPPDAEIRGPMIPISVPLRANKLIGSERSLKSTSGPSRQTPETEFGPSQIPSPSESGLSGFVPVSDSST